MKRGLLCRHLLPGNVAEQQQIRERVAAQAVGAVNTARDFTRGVKPRNHAALRVKHLCLFVDRNVGANLRLQSWGKPTRFQRNLLL